MAAVNDVRDIGHNTGMLTHLIGIRHGKRPRGFSRRVVLPWAGSSWSTATPDSATTVVGEGGARYVLYN